jgi:hypothetical protein
MISGLLPYLGSGGACFDLLWIIALLEGKALHMREVLMVNCRSTQLQPQRVVTIAKSYKLWMGISVCGLCFQTECYVASTFRVLNTSAGILFIPF